MEGVGQGLLFQEQSNVPDSEDGCCLERKEGTGDSIETGSSGGEQCP